VTREFVTKSAEETVEAGREIAAMLAAGRVLLLTGPLGAGKTTLVKGIAEGLSAAAADDVTSPTFTLVHEYAGREKNGAAVRLYHLDLYRVDDERQLNTLGLEEMAASDAIVLVEWGEKFASVAAHADGSITLSASGSDARRIVVAIKNP
jgi:tRNA threonylcarbamoyladenosine biosynthesis protein TsaE